MKEQNNFWKDGNGNKWNCDTYTKEEAARLSKTLVSCTDCTDCSFCSHCVGCKDCSNCYSCYYCENSDNCDFCENCKFCEFCNSCEDCHSCNYSRSCRNCKKCKFCDSCKNLKENPPQYHAGEIKFFYINKRIYVKCDYFWGRIEEFEKKVKKTHGNNNHAKYREEIRKAKMIFEK